MRIIGTGSALPKRVVTNEDLAAIMDTSDEWISSRTGIHCRHLAVDETTTSMALEASQQALAAAGVAAQDVDLIIAGTITPDYLFPTLACELQAALGADRAVAFDLSAGCSGFLYALGTADAYMRTGQYHTALLVGAETLSRIMDWTDRSTCVLFGDGAGAAVAVAEGDGLLAMVQGSEGASGMALSCKNRSTDHPFYRQVHGMEHANEPLAYTHMDGQAVYRFAVRRVPQSITQALSQAHLTADDISLFVLHQANLRIIESVAKRIGQPLSKFPANMDARGNCSAASVPLLLDELVRAGRIRKGDRIVLCGFGAGLTWGTAVLQW